MFVLLGEPYKNAEYHWWYTRLRFRTLFTISFLLSGKKIFSLLRIAICISVEENSVSFYITKDIFTVASQTFSIFAFIYSFYFCIFMYVFFILFLSFHGFPWYFNPLSAKPTKWSNTLKQFSGSSRRIVWVCLTTLCGWRLKG